MINISSITPNIYLSSISLFLYIFCPIHFISSHIHIYIYIYIYTHTHREKMIKIYCLKPFSTLKSCTKMQSTLTIFKISNKLIIQTKNS